MPFLPPNQQRQSTEGKSKRTGLESDFADHEPASVEVELGVDEARDVVGHGNDDVARELDERVAHVVEDDGRRVRVAAPADAEAQHGATEHAHVLAEHVVGVEPDGAEVAHSLELEHDLHRRAAAAATARASTTTTTIATTYRPPPGGAARRYAPRRRQFDPKIAEDLQHSSPHIFGGRRWLSCRQPAYL